MAYEQAFRPVHLGSGGGRVNNYGNFMSDCIHLHACRSLHKRFRLAGNEGAKYVARFCNEDCRCYQKAIRVYGLSQREACEVAWAQYDGPNDERDVYVPLDFPSEDMWKIVNGPACTTNTDEWDDAS